MPSPKWEEIIVHHTASGGVDERTWDAIRRFHVFERGWQDIGYHFGIGRDDSGKPTVFRGRGLNRHGAHCPGHNSTAIGVAFLGLYSDREPPEDILEEGAHLIASLCERYEIEIRSIHPHREFRATECPGEAFPFERLKNRVLEVICNED